MDTESEKRYAERPSATDRVGEEAKAMMVGPEKAADDVEGNPCRPGGRKGLILALLESASVRIYDGHGGKLTEGSAVDLANAIETELEEVDRLFRDEMGAQLSDAQQEIARLLEGREQARAGEDSFKAQRDAALNLLRWLIGDVLGGGFD